jgi:hypothetical protein
VVWISATPKVLLLYLRLLLLLLAKMLLLLVDIWARRRLHLSRRVSSSCRTRREPALRPWGEGSLAMWGPGGLWGVGTVPRRTGRIATTGSPHRNG